VWLLGWMTDYYCDNGLKTARQSEFLCNTRAVKPWQRRADPTRTQRAGVCGQHEVLRSSAAVKGRFGTAGLSAKQNQGRCVPEDFEFWPFSPGPRTTFRLVIVGVLLGASAVARKALDTLDNAQSPRRGTACWWSGRLHGRVQQLLHHCPIDRIGMVLTDGPPRVNGFEYIHDRLRFRDA